MNLHEATDMVALAERLLHSAPKPANDLAYERTASIIAAAIKSANLTVNEMGNILGAITDRICQASLGKYPQFPELEPVAHDLAEICETDFLAAQDKIDERLAEQSAEAIEQTETE